MNEIEHQHALKKEHMNEKMSYTKRMIKSFGSRMQDYQMLILNNFLFSSNNNKWAEENLKGISLETSCFVNII